MVERTKDGKPRRFTSVGGYPMVYVAPKYGDVLCPGCADHVEVLAPNMALVAGINWEDASLYCDSCSERIESAYADDDEEQV